jgi:hypothetical protein
MIRRRATLRRGEPTKEEKQAARVFARDRAKGMCEYRTLEGKEILGVTIHQSPRCLGGPIPLALGHLCHVAAKRRFGWMESDTNRHLWGCFECHMWEHSGGKPVPKK